LVLFIVSEVLSALDKEKERQEEYKHKSNLKEWVLELVKTKVSIIVSFVLEFVELNHSRNVDEVVEEEDANEDWQVKVYGDSHKLFGITHDSAVHDPEQYEKRLPVMVGIAPYECSDSAYVYPHIGREIFVVAISLKLE
jgi:hypothetical protein